MKTTLILNREPFLANNFLKQTTNLLLEEKNPFLFHYVREEKKLNRVKYAQYYNRLKFQDQTVSMKNLFLE